MKRRFWGVVLALVGGIFLQACAYDEATSPRGPWDIAPVPYQSFPPRLAPPSPEPVQDTREPLLRLNGALSSFVYDAAAPLRYTQLKEAWLQAHPGETPALQVLMSIAKAAYASGASPQVPYQPLSEWRMVQGPHPWVMQPRILIENPHQSQAVVGAKLVYRLQAEMGEWYPASPSALTDVQRLEKSARMVTLIEEQHHSLAPLAPQEVQEILLPPLEMLNWLQAYPDTWPLKLHLECRLLRGSTVWDNLTLVLPVLPDVFALPIYLY